MPRQRMNSYGQYHKQTYVLPQRNVTLDRWSLVLISVYFAAQPFADAFHRLPLIGGYFAFVSALVFLLLAFLYVHSGNALFDRLFELSSIVIWSLYVVVWFIMSDKTADPIGVATSESALYSTRFLLQSVPLFLLLVIRGLRRREINIIMTAMVATVPLAIIRAYYDSDILTVAEAREYSAAGYGINYNTFVPFMTFPFVASVYLFGETKQTVTRVLLALISSGIAVFILTNRSRQSVLFVALAILIFLIISKNIKALVLIAFASIMAFYLVEILDLKDSVTERFFSTGALETTRTEHMADGLTYLSESGNWLFGSGLNLSLYTGLNPHSNYIFSVMRFGVIGTVLLFLPFLRGFFQAILLPFQRERSSPSDNSYVAFVAIGLFFTIFHSAFGYPHLDPVNAPIVWFGLGVWVAFSRNVISGRRQHNRSGVLQHS